MNCLEHVEKRSETVSIKITPSLKAELDRLPEVLKHKLINKCINEMHFAVHISKFVPPKPIVD